MSPTAKKGGHQCGGKLSQLYIIGQAFESPWDLLLDQHHTECRLHVGLGRDTKQEPPLI